MNQAPSERKISFTQCVRTSLALPSLVEEFNRLSGHKLGHGALPDPLEAVIQDVKGLADQMMAEERIAVKAFLSFVHDFVWKRLPADVCSEEADALELFVMANPASAVKH